jgi:cytochrome b involved in lipid metabolism
MSKSISLSEISSANTAEKSWLIIDSDVYDVTDFAAGHPGGEAILLEYAGMLRNIGLS